MMKTGMIFLTVFFFTIFTNPVCEADDMAPRQLEEGEHLALWTRRLPGIPRNPKDLDLSKPAKFADSDWGARRGNGVFLISKGISRDVQDKVLWLTYSQTPQIGKRDTAWLANLTWHPSRNAYYAVLVNSIRGRSQFAVFYINPFREIADFPPLFNPDSYEDWLEPSPRMPAYEYEVKYRHIGVYRKKFICKLEWVDLMPQRNGLLVYGDATEPRCLPIYLRLDLNSGEWTDMTIVE